MKVMIIGGAGYIGSHVALELADAGHEIAVFDNLSSGLKQNLQEGTPFFRGDIMDLSYLTESLQNFGAEAVIHLAALKAAGESMESPEKYASNNISGSINILGACSVCGIKRIVFSSTAAVYGDPERLPVDETHSRKPINFYGHTKLAVEKLMEWYDQILGIRSARLRYFNAAGYDVQGRVWGLEQNPANLIPVVMEAACGMRGSLTVFGDDYETEDGTGVRDYVHVNDLATGHLLALEYLEKNGRSLTVNLGSEKGASVLEIIRETERVSGKKVPFEVGPRRAGDPDKLIASSTKAKKLLGWEATRSDVATLIESSWKAYESSSR